MKNNHILPLISISALLGLVLLSEGCYYDNAKDLYPVDTVYVLDTTGMDTTGTSFTWANDVQPIVNTNCAYSGCHNANSAVRQPLSTYDEMKGAIENWNLRNRVSNGSMPPAGNMSETDKQTLLDWIDAGYPNN